MPHGATRAKPVVPCLPPMWGDIPVIRLHIPPRPEAAVSCGRDECGNHSTSSIRSPREIYIPSQNLSMITPCQEKMRGLKGVGYNRHVLSIISMVPTGFEPMFSTISDGLARRLTRRAFNEGIPKQFALPRKGKSRVSGIFHQ